MKKIEVVHPNDVEESLLVQQVEQAQALLRVQPEQVISITQVIIDKVISLKEGISQTANTFSQIEMEARLLMSYAYMKTGSIELAIETAEQLASTAVINRDYSYRALSQQIQGKVAIHQGLYEKAKKLLQNALPEIEKVERYDYLVALFNDLARIEQFQNNYNEALKHYLKAEEINNLYPNSPILTPLIHSNIGTVLLLIGDYNKAKLYYQQAALEHQQLRDILGYAQNLIKISTIHAHTEEYAQQIELLHEALSIFRDNSLNADIPMTLLALGGAYFDNGDITQANNYLRQAMKELTKAKDIRNIALCHLRFAHLYAHKKYKQRSITKAEQHFAEAEKIAIENNLSHFRSSMLNDWAEFYRNNNKTAEAFELLKRSHEVERQVLNETSLRRLRELEVQYDVALKERENELLRISNQAALQERDHIQQQLTTKAQAMLTQLEAINQFKSEILDITKKIDKAENILRQVKLKLKEAPVMRADWDAFLELFTKVHPDFQAKLRKVYPDLTQMELKICTLIKAGVKTHEIAELLCLSERNIENHRYRIRKKMKLSRNESIATVVEGVV